MLKYYIMNIVIEQREEVFKENNTAQSELLKILNNLHKASDTLTINKSLYGDIDLSILNEYGFKNLKKIVFNDGSITSIVNIPSNIIELKISNNLLLDLKRLPNTLEILDIENNYIDNIDFSELISIKKINISHNNFDKLTNLPTNLTDIVCNNNNITYINLFELNSLENLNASNNKITVIDNLPDNITELILDNNPNIQYHNTNVLPQVTEKDSETNYYDCLNQYFKLKNDYETKFLKSKRKVYNDAIKKGSGKSRAKKLVSTLKPTCIYCKRNVGSIFTTKLKNYKCICGDSVNPCPLNIQLFAGDYFNLLDLIQEYSDVLRDTREEIIMLKLNSLFDYNSKDITLTLYNKKLEEYSKESSGFDQLMERYNEIFLIDDNNNKDKHIQIKDNLIKIKENTDLAKKLLNEYKTSNNDEFLKQAISTYVDEIIPKIKNNNLLLFNNIYINTDTDANKSEMHSLIKEKISYSNLEYTYGEKPNVKSFKIMPSGNTPKLNTDSVIDLDTPTPIFDLLQ